MSKVEKPQKLTIILCSDSLDRALITFMMVNAARSMGLEVRVFFALWGVNLLRRHSEQAPVDKAKAGGLTVERTLISRLMGLMMPRGPDGLPLSKLNFGGIGAALMRRTMRKRGASSLTELMNMAVDLGAKFTVCSLTAELMGYPPADLLDLPNLDFGGMAGVLGEALESKMFLVM